MRAIILSLLTLMALGTAHAQMVNSGAQLSVANGTTLGVDMDLLNTGDLINQGDILLTGDWMNVGVYDSTGGQLIFTSQEIQEIMNNGQEINNLVIQNGIKTLNDDLKITGGLTLDGGILQVQEEAKLTLGQGVLITGAGEDAYINGKLYRLGTGDLFYPIGSETEYLPVTLTDVIGNNPEIGLQAFAGVPPQALGLTLEEYAVDAYWQLFADETYGSGFITLPYSDADDLDRLAVAQADDPTSEFSTIGNSSVSGDLSGGFVTSLGNAIGPYFSVAIAPEIVRLPPLIVVNAITPLQDGKHDFLRIENIELYPDNRVEIFDRHGNKVFTITNYDNRDRVFRGIPNHGISGELPDGNYFYTIKTGRRDVKSGFLFLKR